LKAETGAEGDLEGQLLLPFLAEEANDGPEVCEVARGFAEERGEGRVQETTLVQPARVLVSAEVLTRHCQEWLETLGLPGAAKLVKVQWNHRLRSTAGYAAFPAWRIELNPRLAEFDGQVERTLKHELAHLIAYHRAGRRRIEPHGQEWREACVALGIAGERACHQLPLPRRRVERKLAYQCPACQFILYRVRRFRRATACLNCCNQHNRGVFDERFKFVLVRNPEAAAADS
jgi:SprT protein